MLHLQFASHTDPGKVRELNEDSLGWHIPADAETGGPWLFVLADGVGGHAAGEVASRMAVDVIAGGVAGSRDAPAASLRKLLQLANQKIHDAGLSGAHGGAMASTVVALALDQDRATLAHAGDSRCYLWRAGSLRQMTRDHRFAAEQAALGILTFREAEAAPTQSYLTRSLGADLMVQPEINEFPLLAGDLFLLCSDGLHGALDVPALERELAAPRPLDAAARRLVELARDRDGSDNISAILVRVLEVERMAMYRGRAYRVR